MNEISEISEISIIGESVIPLMPGDYVVAGRTDKYKRDDITPWYTLKELAEVVARYGNKTWYSLDINDNPIWEYYDCIDIRFADGSISKGVLTAGVIPIYVAAHEHNCAINYPGMHSGKTPLWN